MQVDLVGQLLNLVYFAVGLGVGIFGIYLSVRFFLAQQQDKFNLIAADLTAMRETLSRITEQMSAQSAVREERFFGLVARREHLIEGATSDATEALRAVVQDQLAEAGVSDAVQRSQQLEQRLTEIVSSSAHRVFTAGTDASGAYEWRLPYSVAEIVINQLGDPFSRSDFVNGVRRAFPEIDPSFASQALAGLIESEIIEAVPASGAAGDLAFRRVSPETTMRPTGIA
jgi:hypothetical protein